MYLVRISVAGVGWLNVIVIKYANKAIEVLFEITLSRNVYYTLNSSHQTLLFYRIGLRASVDFSHKWMKILSMLHGD